ncbi:MAG: MFS transporter [Thermodesulfobacteriota bacterium]
MKLLPKTVIYLGFVSFFTDLSSEMIYPLLPIFLSSVLGAGTVALGVIEGTAESTAAFLKVLSGLWTDRLRHRKPLILPGYGLSGAVRPLIGLATAWPLVLVLRFMDRVGKGLRTSPRDALIADVTNPGQRGAAYGLHRAMDHAGAVVGPIVAAGLLSFESISLRHVFLLSAIPAAVVMVVLIAGVKEPRIPLARDSQPSGLVAHWSDLGREFKRLLLALLVFTLGNSTDAFLLLRLSGAGVPAAWVAVLWSLHHGVKMFSTYIGGRLSDRIGRRRMILSGWIVYAGIYFAFAVVDSPTMLIVVFVGYGIYFGLTEPSERAWVADLVPKHLRGTAFGYYHGVIGLGALPGSLLFGFLWHRFGVGTAFLSGAGLAMAASILLFLVRSEPATGARPDLQNSTV